MPYHALVRFGRWEEMLDEPAPGEELPFATALWHYARGVALANLGRVDKAREELAAVEAAKSDPAFDGLVMASFASALQNLDMASGILSAAIAGAEGDHESAIAQLEAAVATQDSLPYIEPPAWYFPIRHLLGAELLAAGRAEEAEAVYRKDLEQYPANGWSLFGLSQALDAQAAATRREFEAAWSGSDIELPLNAAPTINTAAAGAVSPNDPIEVQIANAMSAAPLAISQEAAIYGFPADESGEMVLLREGTNDWTCFTDWPASPSNDPMCNDPTFTAWYDAFLTGEAPEIPQPGISYMLLGGDDTSNTDPFASTPAAGEEWVTTPPHLMLVVPGGLDPEVFTTDHTSGEPYIMWEGTPYEHLMIPVADMEHDHD
jgi:hypothetical protein